MSIPYDCRVFIYNLREKEQQSAPIIDGLKKEKDKIHLSKNS